MKTNRYSLNFARVALLGLLVGSCGAAVAGQPNYHLLKEIPVGGDGSWDYLSVDTEGHRLFISHGTKVVVIDVEKDAVVGEIDDTPGVHGIAIAAKLGRAFSSNGRENKVSIIDLKTLKTLSKVETGTNPDSILFEPSQEEVYAFNGRSASATVIDAKSGKVTATIDLAGKPEFSVADSKAGRVYCNLEDKSEVAAIDIKAHQVVNRWPIAPGQEASGMAFDAEHHRLFLGCGNKLMVMMDSTSGKVLAQVPIGDGVDANAFDPGTHLAFASCGGGEGSVIIAQEDAPNKLTVVQTLKTEPRAKTMTLDPTTHKIYLGSAKFEAAAAGGRRPNMVPGTFKVLVYGM